MYLLLVLPYLILFEFYSQTRENLVPKQVAQWSRRKGTTSTPARNIPAANLPRQVRFLNLKKFDVLQNMCIPGFQFKLQFILFNFLSDDDIYLYKLPDGYYMYILWPLPHLIYIWLLQSNKRTSSPRTSSSVERKIDFDDQDSARQPLSPLPYNSPDCRIRKK